ncbi:MAG: DUF3179 domain-containing protein [Pseudomonadota bacterium]
MSLSLTRRAALASAGALLVPSILRAQDDYDEVLRALQTFVFGTSTDIPPAIDYLRGRGGTDLASSLIFALRYSRYPRSEIIALLEDVSGASAGGDWNAWMLWQEGNPQIKSHPAYYEFKRTLFMQVDPRWRPFLEPDLIADGAMDIRFEEVAWGGVRRDGIPSLDFPEKIPAAEADYLRDDDLVFGVEINGDVRAYPLRIMGWHEMFNEVIGDVPVALAYCTLCGSGILFETRLEDRERPFIMGTSGFLYRSNKLMYDRQTESLWNQFTGEPVSGELRGSGIVLKQRPVVIAPWGDWRARNPGTQVLSLNTGWDRDYGSGVVYQEYFASPELMFPARVDQSRLRQKDYVYAIRTFGAAKAWALELFDGPTVVNDVIGDTPIVLIGDAAGRTVRAYERGGREFELGSDGALVADGGTWSVDEAALASPDGESLPRVPGHIAYWFAWNNYLGPQGEVVTR